MALTKEEVVRMEVSSSDIITQVITTIIYEDGVEISRAKRREPIQPGDDYSTAPPVVRRMCAQLHVPSAVAKWNAWNALEEARATANENAIPGLETAYENAVQNHQQFLENNS